MTTAKRHYTASDFIEHQKALALHAALASVSLLAVPVLGLSRSTPRKEQAKAARQLFKQLGLPHISVTTPNYSMAQSVDVQFPRRMDVPLNEHGTYVMESPEQQANNAAREKLEQVIHRAFPNHGDRSDHQSDYFDYKWSIA